ncbi:phosphotransferase family protein [Amycolatopsis granulosa]|uniref:phosphotransferase family protein n=1 Tax=Amycolatopsis granulosa TaxID=185684 RepID=UPI0014223280|nr:phosphotransferase [Amycolatopsis granulosa]NIH83917.1 hypothetical protein [Amycolatopsis granulosa]
MTSSPAVHTGPAHWQAVLPPGRRFVALPSRRRPVVVAEEDPSVLRYVRTCLLAAPPGSTLPGWVFGAARQALRLPVSWRLAPHLRAPTGATGRFDRLAAGHRLLVLRHSHDPDARILLLLFAPDGRWPRHAAKVSSDPAGAARVLREADRLRAIGGLSLGPVRATVPEVVAVLSDDGSPALVTTAVPGTPMLVGYHRRGHTSRPATVRADFSAAGAWLAAFQSGTTDGVAPLDLAPGVPERLRHRLGARPDGGQRVQDQLAALRQRLGRHQGPRTAVHGDFWPGNLLLDRGAVTGVVDWEWAEPAGSPVRDVARFVLTYSQYLAKHTPPGRQVRGHPGLLAGRPDAALGYALDGEGWYPRLVREFLHTGLRRVGMTPGCARDAVLAELAAVAAEATDRAFGEEQVRVFERLAGQVPS